MESIVWNEQYNMGIEIVDTAHAKLFRIVDKLRDRLQNEQAPQRACEEGIKYLESYTMKHFSEEEAYMRSVRYKGYVQHKKIHDNFRDKTLVSLRNDLQLSNYSSLSVERFIGVMTGWLTGHILTEDLAIVGKVATRRRYNLSSKISVIEKAVGHTMEDVFHVESKLASADYKGENLGNAFYCRLHYDIDNGGKVQILLGVEEQLILKGVGQVMVAAPSQRSNVVNAAALQIFEVLFHHMGKLFRSETTYELTKNGLLTKDEFRADFMKGYPCSLLFDTRLGHFVFCFRTWKGK